MDEYLEYNLLGDVMAENSILSSYDAIKGQNWCHVFKVVNSFIPRIISRSLTNFQRFGIAVGLGQVRWYFLDFILHHLFYISQKTIFMRAWVDRSRVPKLGIIISIVTYYLRSSVLECGILHMSAGWVVTLQCHWPSAGAGPCRWSQRRTLDPSRKLSCWWHTESSLEDVAGS